MSNDERIKKITDIIIEWAEGKAKNGEIEFDRKYCKHYADHNTVRYWTKETTYLIPDNSEGKETSFGNHNMPEAILHVYYDKNLRNRTMWQNGNDTAQVQIPHG